MECFLNKKTTDFSMVYLVIPEGFEPSTYCLEGSCSIQLSYGTKTVLVQKTVKKSGWQDSNLRPPAPKAGAITGLRYTPKIKKRRVRDSNPWYSFPYACLANMSFRPLRQLSRFSIMLKELNFFAVANVTFHSINYNYFISFFNH